MNLYSEREQPLREWAHKQNEYSMDWGQQQIKTVEVLCLIIQFFGLCAATMQAILASIISHKSKTIFVHGLHT